MPPDSHTVELAPSERWGSGWTPQVAKVVCGLPIPRFSRSELAFGFLLVFNLALMFWFQRLGIHLITDAAPNGILSFQVAHVAKGSAPILTSWLTRPGAIEAARLSLYWDFLFIPTYTGLLMWACRKAGGIYKDLGKPTAMIWAWIVFFLMPLAAVADVTENLALLSQLPDHPSIAKAAIAFWAASAKFTIVLFALGITVPALALWSRPHLASLSDLFRALGSTLWACLFPLIATVTLVAFLMLSDQGNEVLIASHDPTVARSQHHALFIILAIALSYAVYYCARLILRQGLVKAKLTGPRWNATNHALTDLVGLLPILLGLISALASIGTFELGRNIAMALLSGLLGLTALALLLRAWFHEPSLQYVEPERAAFWTSAVTQLSTREFALGILFIVVAVVALASVSACLYDPIDVPRWFGAASVIAAAAAFWTIALSVGLVFLPRSFGFPSLALAVPILAVWASYSNDNHVPRHQTAVDSAPRVDLLEQYLFNWLKTREFDKDKNVPIVVAAAAGGGLRAAYWTANTLGYLHQRSEGKFAKHLFAISGVSGGSLGAAAYVATLNGDGPVWRVERDEPLKKMQAFFSAREDFLSPLLSAMLLGDAFQRIVPLRYDEWDRARALEDSWAASWSKLHHEDFFDSYLVKTYQKQSGRLPLLFLNATQVESGKRFIVSPLRLSSEDFLDSYFLFGTNEYRDTAPNKPGADQKPPPESLGVYDMTLKTAVHLSARFSYVSPPATFLASPSKEALAFFNSPNRLPGQPVLLNQQVAWGRVVDGGYFENSGAATAQEIVLAIKTAFQRMQTAGVMPADMKIHPVVLMIDNSPKAYGSERGLRAQRYTPREPNQIEMLTDLKLDPRSTFRRSIPISETASPIETLLNTRQARGELAIQSLIKMQTPIEQCWRPVDCELKDDRNPLRGRPLLRNCDTLPQAVYTVRLSEMYAMQADRRAAMRQVTNAAGPSPAEPDLHEPALGWYLGPSSAKTMDELFEKTSGETAVNRLVTALAHFESVKGKVLSLPKISPKWPDDFLDDDALTTQATAGRVCRVYSN